MLGEIVNVSYLLLRRPCLQMHSSNSLHNDQQIPEACMSGDSVLS